LYFIGLKFFTVAGIDYISLNKFNNNQKQHTMSRIKEFYHDEICAMQRENDLEDDAYLSDEFLAQEQEAVEAQIAEFENEKAAVEASNVPSFHHPKF